MGCVASTCPVRGDPVEPFDVTRVLAVGLFDGIGALRVAADAWFPSAIVTQDVLQVDLEMVK